MGWAFALTSIHPQLSQAEEVVVVGGGLSRLVGAERKAKVWPLLFFLLWEGNFWGWKICWESVGKRTICTTVMGLWLSAVPGPSCWPPLTLKPTNSCSVQVLPLHSDCISPYSFLSRWAAPSLPMSHCWLKGAEPGAVASPGSMGWSHCFPTGDLQEKGFIALWPHRVPSLECHLLQRPMDRDRRDFLRLSLDVPTDTPPPPSSPLHGNWRFPGLGELTLMFWGCIRGRGVPIVGRWTLMTWIL